MYVCIFYKFLSLWHPYLPLISGVSWACEMGLGVFPPLQFFVKDLEKDWLYAS